MLMIGHKFKLETGIASQTRDGSNASGISTHIVDGLLLIQLVMDSVSLELMCFPASGDDFFQRVPCGSLCADSNDPHQRVALVALVLHGSAHG